MSNFATDFADDAWDQLVDTFGVSATYVNPSSAVANVTGTVIIREAPTLTMDGVHGRDQALRNGVARCHPDTFPFLSIGGRFQIGADDEAGIQEWTITAQPVKRNSLWHAPVAFRGTVRMAQRASGGA